MNEANTVTISVDEYFELRQKAEMNMTVVREIASFENRMNALADKLFELDSKVREIDMITAKHISGRYAEK